MFVIEDGILKAYFGHKPVVVVPEGVVQIGGNIEDASWEESRNLCATPFTYRGFYSNKTVQELYLPDSVTRFGFKSLQHCDSLRVLSFSNHMERTGCEELAGCRNLKTIIFRGTVYEFTCLRFESSLLELEAVYCTDGQILFGQDRQHYIGTLYYPGTRAQWKKRYGPDDWRNTRSRRVVCLADRENQKQPDFSCIREYSLNGVPMALLPLPADEKFRQQLEYFLDNDARAFGFGYHMLREDREYCLVYGEENKKSQQLLKTMMTEFARRKGLERFAFFGVDGHGWDIRVTENGCAELPCKKLWAFFHQPAVSKATEPHRVFSVMQSMIYRKHAFARYCEACWDEESQDYRFDSDFGKYFAGFRD